MGTSASPDGKKKKGQRGPVLLQEGRGRDQRTREICLTLWKKREGIRAAIEGGPPTLEKRGL